MTTKFRYQVSYLRRPSQRRVWHRVVTAASPDEAREIVKGLDPEFTGTVRTPRRRAAVTELETA